MQVEEEGKSKSPKKDRPQVRYVDATGQIAGRLCSNVAKLLLNGDRVIVVNAERTLISGQRGSVMEDWLAFLKLGSVVHPRHGPYHERTPDGILTGMVRGMLPRRKPKGLAALRRLRVYVGVPEEYSKIKFQGFEDAAATKPQAYYVKLSEIASRIGWKGAEREGRS